MLATLIESIKEQHFANPPASARMIEEFEASNRWQLDPELREFYLACNGARLFRSFDSPYNILPLNEIVRTRRLIFGRDTDEDGPASQYAICDVWDGNYVSIDVSRPMNGLYPLIDSFHETFSDPAYYQVIASSFAVFLDKALKSEGRHFWLD